MCACRSCLSDHDAHAGDPLRHQVVVAQLRTQARPSCARPRAAATQVRTSCAPKPATRSISASLMRVEVLEPGARETSSRKSRSHCSLGGRHGPLPTTRSRAALMTRLSRASSPPASASARTISRCATLRRAHVEPRRRRIVRQAAGADHGDPHVLVGQEFADCCAEGPHAAERGPRIGGAIDEHRQHVVARERPVSL